MILQVKNLSKVYKNWRGNKTTVLDNISFNIELGYIYGLVGRNGAGKTTLISSIAYGDCEDENIMYGNDYSMKKNPVECTNMIGVISDPPMLLTNKTAIENGEIFGTAYESWDGERFEKKLREFRIDPNVNLSKLSRGQAMKVSVAFAWGHRPTILLADEPNAGFDPLFRKQFMNFLQEYVEDGEHSVIMSTHILDELDAVADYIMILKKGKLIYNKSLEEMRDEYAFINDDVPGILDVMCHLEKRDK